MIYQLLKILSKLTIFGYFRKWSITGKENIPENDPVIFVANHPSAFMDPIVAAASVKRPVYFLAAGEYVGKGIQGWFFQRMLHMIPIFRPSTRPGETHKNQDSFKRCHEHLGKGGTLIIFPEGVSLTERKLKSLKTGTVRIAIGAEKEYNRSVAIVPIGLNYSDPHSFRSDLLIQIGKPFYLSNEDELQQTYNTEVIKELTLELENRLRSLVLHLPTPGTEKVFEKLDAIFTRDLKNELNITFSDQVSEFELQKGFSDAILYFQQEKPELYTITLDQMEAYENALTQADLIDKDIAGLSDQLKYRRVWSFLLGLPFFILGVINNVIPYKASGWLARKLTSDRTFAGSFVLAMGLGLFTIWYIGISILLGSVLFGWWALLYPILMYATGIYALIYLTAAKQSKRRIHLRQIAKQQPELIEDIKEKRNALITLFKGCQEDYLKSQEAKLTLEETVS